jgi:hypothetical protein
VCDSMSHFLQAHLTNNIIDAGRHRSCRVHCRKHSSWLLKSIDFVCRRHTKENIWIFYKQNLTTDLSLHFQITCKPGYMIKKHSGYMQAMLYDKQHSFHMEQQCQWSKYASFQWIEMCIISNMHRPRKTERTSTILAIYKYFTWSNNANDPIQ